jgi:hypothetical protein
LEGCGKTQSRLAKRQGTTSVVPKSTKRKRQGFSPGP